MQSKQLTKPTLHSNGTSAKELSLHYLTAYHAVIKAIKETNNANPNGRDYYPQGNDALKKQ